MAGSDERNGAYVVPPEMREFVRKRDQRKCLLCGASNTPPDAALIVAGSPWDEIELEWLKERGLVPDSFGAIHPQNIICLCPNHHELFLHRRWCFVPCPEDRHAMLSHEQQNMGERRHHRALGHDPPPRSLPQLSGKFDFLNCAFGDEALSLTPAGGRMTLVSTMPPDHESALHLPRPPQYPLPGVNPYVVLAHAAKCVGGPRRPIFPDVEQEITELVNAYNLDVGAPHPPHHSPRESSSTRNSDSHSHSRSSSPTSSMDAPPPPPVAPPSARARTFPKPSPVPSPEQTFHTPYGVGRQDTYPTPYPNPTGTQPIPIFRPPSALATGTHPDGSPSSGTGTADRTSIPPPPPIPHHLQSQTNLPHHLQPQLTGTGAGASRRRASDNPPPTMHQNTPPPPPPPPAPQPFSQASQSFPQYTQYTAAPGPGPGLTRRSSKLRHSDDLRGSVRSPPPHVGPGVGPRSPDRDRVVSGGAGSGGSGKSPDQPPQRRESYSQHPRPRERDRDRDRDRERDSRGEPFVFGPDISTTEIITRLTEGRSSSSADFSGRRRNGST